MRKIEEAMCAAIKMRRNWRCDNTEVRIIENNYLKCYTIEVYLYGNHIYKKHSSGTAMFTLADWPTNTTISRLRALGLNICRRDNKPLYKGEYIDSNKWYTV